MNELSNERRAQVIGCICEGMSIRATSRLTGVSKNTITKLICDVGEAASIYQDRRFRQLDSKKIQADEIWSFVGMKQRNVPEEREFDEIGSVWTWVALDSDSKLVVTWLVGDRSGDSAYEFLNDLERRLSKRIQLTTDAYQSYRTIVPVVFGKNVDFGTVTKKYAGGNEDHRYSPGQCTGVEKRRRIGYPNMRSMSTSHIERQNLSIRMGSRRYTRLTNAFSKKFQNHALATAMHFAYYNLVLTHGTLNKRYGAPTTPAMAAGVETRPWTTLDLVELLDCYEAIAA